LGPQRILAEPSVHLFEDTAAEEDDAPQEVRKPVHLLEDADRWGGVAYEALCGPWRWVGGYV